MGERRFYDPSNPTLLTSVTAHMDLLGFKERVSDGRTRAEREQALRSLKAALDEAYEALRASATAGSDDEKYYEVKSFTDNVVIGQPWGLGDEDGEIELGWTLRVVAEHQARLLRHGMIVRGGLSVGELYIDENVVYGGALLEAVAEGDRSGSPPRVALTISSRPLLERYQRYYSAGRSPFNTSLLVDLERDEIFVDYLGTAFEHFPDGDFDRELLDRHRTLIRDGLRSSERSVRPKYRWVREYHDFVVRRFLAPYQRLISSIDPAKIDEEYAAAAYAALEVERYVIRTRPPKHQRFTTLVEYWPDARLGTPRAGTRR